MLQMKWKPFLRPQETLRNGHKVSSTHKSQLSYALCIIHIINLHIIIWPFAFKSNRFIKFIKTSLKIRQNYLKR